MPVNEASIKRLLLRKKEDEVLEGQIETIDPETNEPIIPQGRWAHFTYSVRRWFLLHTNRIYWKRKFQKSEGEVLVDGPLLFYAYIEAGFIEALGCLTCYFMGFYLYTGMSPTDVYSAGSSGYQFTSGSGPLVVNGKSIPEGTAINGLHAAESSFYISCMIIQCFNLFCCKCRWRLPFGRKVFENWRTFVGMAAGIALACFIVYVRRNKSLMMCVLMLTLI